MAVSVTNRVAASALPGEVVMITLDATDKAKLPTIITGMQAQAITSLKIGYVSAVDVYGSSFQVRPRYPSTAFDNGTPGVFIVGDGINLT